MELIGFIGNLKTHEMERMAREEMVPQKKTMIAFKSTPTIFDDDEEDDDDEDLSLLVRNVRRMYNKAKINSRRRWQGKEEKKIICFNCRKSGHIMVECPNFRNKLYSSNKPNKPSMKKALKAT